VTHKWFGRKRKDNKAASPSKNKAASPSRQNILSSKGIIFRPPHRHTFSQGCWTCSSTLQGSESNGTYMKEKKKKQHPNTPQLCGVNINVGPKNHVSASAHGTASLARSPAQGSTTNEALIPAAQWSFTPHSIIQTPGTSASMSTLDMVPGYTSSVGE
jgi:hypothetical protein